MNTALLMILVFWIFSIMLALLSIRGRKMNMEQWIVGGRGMGSIFTFLLLAGETYSIFTLLGTSGIAYAKGAGAYFLIAFTALGASTSYWLLPPIWRYARAHNLLSQSEFFAAKYRSPSLGLFIAIVGALALVPYITLLFKSMGILVALTSYETIDANTAIWMGMLSLIVYVIISGIHGSAWVSLLKDILITSVIIFLAIYLPIHYSGSYYNMFQDLNIAKPGFLTFSMNSVDLPWFLSTVIISVIGYFMWPHNTPAIFSAKSAKVFRINAFMLPLYSLMIILVYIIGFTAALNIPGLTGSQTDNALLNLSMQTFEPWVVGLIGATGLLSTLVPGSMMLMSVSTMLMKNVYLPAHRNSSPKHQIIVVKILVVIIGLLCTWFALSKSDTLATLYVTSFGMVTQLSPALLCSLQRKNPVTATGAFSGIVIGIVIMLYATFSKATLMTLLSTVPVFVQQLNIGIIALAFNVAVMFIVSFLSGKQVNNRE